MKRRIKCDRSEPQCGKCIKKGIICPGMGIRYRFNDGIAARGRFKGKSKPVIDEPKPPVGTAAAIKTGSEGNYYSHKRFSHSDFPEARICASKDRLVFWKDIRRIFEFK
jgi:hypothetical protein